MRVGAVVVAVLFLAAPVPASEHSLTVSGNKLLFDGREFKVVGLRCSNALASDDSCRALVAQLPVYKGYGVNTVSVYWMGSRFGDVKGYRPDATLDPVYARRMEQIVEAADRHGIVVLVGCLYWSTSRAKEDLEGKWTEADAARAVANTVTWLKEHDYRHTMVDPDNEGMASRQMGWSTAAMIDAGHKVDPRSIIGNNCRGPIPPRADVLMHHSAKDGRRPWFESEGSPPATRGGYWGSYSKQPGYYNYIRIGRYTEKMKQSQIAATEQALRDEQGYILASTWLQCGAAEGIGGPFPTPGGRATNEAVDADVRRLAPDAGILWWLEYLRARQP